MSGQTRAALALFIAAAARPAFGATGGPLSELSAAPASARMRAPAAAWDGTQYVVVWEDGRASGSGSEIYLARLSAAGAVMDANGIAVLSPAQPGDQTQPTIAYSATTMTFLLAWTDPRAGASDIYAARFFPMGMGSVPEPGGIQLTLGAAAESSPAIGCANQSCLVAYSAIPVGGTSQVRGLRILPNGDPHDTAPFEIAGAAGQIAELGPAVAAFPDGFVVAWEDDRNSAVSGADLFARSIPDVATVPPSTGASLAVGPLRQSAVALAPLGANLVAVWQDQRAGTSTANDDLWGGVWDRALAPVVPARLLVGAPRNQSFPSVAASARGAGAVFGDLRGGTLALGYAQLLDANLSPKPPASFPAIVASSNIIETTIVKGPGDDYLVLGVRTSPAPSRILYRILRDEAPAGTMTATGTLQVAANGVAVAQVSFGPANGPSGLPVVDGTLYTLSLSRPVDLTVSDLDPTLSGIQLAAVNGRVGLGLRTLAPGPVTVSLSSVEGTAAGSGMVVFDNVPPSATNARIVPAMPTSSEDIEVQYQYSDLNGDAEGSTQIQWTRNSAIQAQHNDQRRVPASSLRRGEVWRARIRPHDGRGFGDFVFSTDVVILNTAPSAADVRIEPGMGVRTGTRLSAVYRFVDIDRDAEMGSVLRWYRDGVRDPVLDGVREIAGANVAKGQTWRFTILPSDGSNPGSLVSSATVSVENSPPTASAGAMATVVERRRHTLDARGSRDIDPSDTLRYRWTQLAGDPVALDDASAPTPAFAAPSVMSTAILRFAVVVSDGEADSAPAMVVVQVTPVADSDADGLDDEEEAALGTNPMFGDTDRDGLQDGVEVAAGTNPLDADSDDDGVRDGAEMEPVADTDMDRLVNALDPDSDGDGLFDGTELGIVDPLPDTNTASRAFARDEDRSTTTNPLLADTDGDALTDGVEDANRNGRVDLGESDPTDPTSKVGCTPERSCPGSLVCLRDACREPAPVDGGLVCRKLVETSVQCCMGADCASATPVGAICLAQGALEQCPAGARQCSVNACGGPPTPTPNQSCGCESTSSGPSLLWLGLLLTFARRRR